MTYTTDNRDRFPLAQTGQEGDDDTPLTDLRMLDINLKVGLLALMEKNKPLADSLGRDGVDIDLVEMAVAINDVIDDYLGAQLRELEDA